MQTIASINSCKTLRDGKFECVDKFVKQDHDLRYCNLLSKLDKNKCIDENWNDILKYNLKKAVQTKDKTYCDKIGNDGWTKRCYAGIK